MNLDPTLYRARFLVPISSPPVEDGALLVRQGRIVAVGRGKDLAADHPQAATVDFGDAVMLPPMVNAHTHLELTHFPRWARQSGEPPESGDFLDWILRVIRVKRNVDPEAFAPSLAAGIDRSLRSGTGAVGDILSCFPARRGYAEAPLKGRLYLETLGRDPEVNRRVLDSIGRILKEKRAGFLQLGLSPHSPYTLSAAGLADVFDFARRRRVPCAIHFAESVAEVEFLRHSTGALAERLYPFVGWEEMVPPPAGRSPAGYLADCRGLAADNLLVHGVQASREDIERIAASGAAVVLCPRSNARLGVGRAPVDLYRRTGVPLALGTDSIASCDSLSLWDEIAFALDWFDGELAPAELLAIATAGGARALGLGGEMGALEPGLAGSFQVLDLLEAPPLCGLEGRLCARGREFRVAALYLDGIDVLQNP